MAAISVNEKGESMNELLIQQFEQNYYNYSKEIRNMLLKLDTESLIAKLARDSKMYQLKKIPI